MTQSVLTEADPRSLDDLFNLDPLKLSADESAIERGFELLEGEEQKRLSESD